MKKIVVFTGAGVSADSGLSTFRDADGLWANDRIEDVCTPEALARNRSLVIEFYNKRRKELLSTEPNAAHYAIAELVLRICRALVRDENTIMPVSVLATGEYGINDVCIGLPSIIGYGGVKRVLEIPLDRTERALLQKSADALRAVIESLDEETILV